MVDVLPSQFCCTILLQIFNVGPYGPSSLWQCATLPSNKSIDIAQSQLITRSDDKVGETRPENSNQSINFYIRVPCKVMVNNEVKLPPNASRRGHSDTVCNCCYTNTMHASWYAQCRICFVSLSPQLVLHSNICMGLRLVPMDCKYL